MRPCCALAAMPTAQWHAELTSQVRPASIDSNAPRLTSLGAPSVEFTDGLRDLSSECLNTYSRPSSVK